MECVADRFVMTGRQSAIDLATGAEATLIVSSSGGHDEQISRGRADATGCIASGRGRGRC